MIVYTTVDKSAKAIVVLDIGTASSEVNLIKDR